MFFMNTRKIRLLNSFFEELPKVSEDSNASLKRALRLGELHEALQSMENAKAPGIDGIPVKIIKRFGL